MAPVDLSFNQYGKTKVRVAKVLRHSSTHHEFKELEVECLLRGDFAESYTVGDNRKVVPTDTIKNTIYVLAKQDPLRSIEEFGIRIVRHFLSMYSWVDGVKVEISQIRWVRVPIGEGHVPHEHSFVRTTEVHTTKVDGTRKSSIHIESGIDNMVVLKTTGSGFENFNRCQYTTLKEATDRILSTKVECKWKFNTTAADFNDVWEGVRQIVMDTFATSYSKAVQETVYVMGNKIIDKYADVESVWFSLPNIHYFPVDLMPFGIEDTPTEVFKPTSDPSGLIQGTISRKKAKL